MTVFCFYMYGDDLIDERGIKHDTITTDELGRQYTLYGFTNKKGIRKEFINQRNISILYEKEIEMTSDEYEKMIDEFGDYLIESWELNTKKVSTKGEYRMSTISMCCTNFEYQGISLAKDENFNEFVAESLEPVSIKDNYIDIMFNCLNDELRDILYNIFLMDDVLPSVFPYEECPNDSVIIDELSLFVKLYHNTLRRLC